ncbi:MAG: nif-specific transcriptional activator NifA [Thermodesulfobacteriaceae bacterium]|nr:nif-specific transcriptional activator NifA [Thermodesulfobacteriaceae bacterium]MDW8136182.1 nif-specific transcriptional activator NifA [Thermodesulfobacterium sp.]
MNLLERQKRELSALLEISKTLSSSFNLIENLNQALKTLSDYLDMRRGTVTLLDPSTNELRIVVAYGLTPEQMARGRYKIGEGIVGKVVETGQSIVVPDIGKEPLFLNRTGARIPKDNISFLCVPLKIEDEILGVLSVDRIFDESISFEEDLRVLEIVATLFSQAIKLYQIFWEEKSKREELERELQHRYQFHNLVYVSDKMKEVIKICLKIAKSKASVLIRGESGTGKELIAKAIHYNSDRAKEPFIAINCAAIPENLLEAELFGYEKGAFTGAYNSKKGKFELANGGTIFLDEIGDLNLTLQAKILRVLQEQSFERLGGTKTIKVDLRIIAATNRPLEEMITEGKFREDLYWRLNVVPIYLPPLRERKEDIPILVEHFLKKFNKEYQRNVKIEPKVLDYLLNYHWPGNVRELENLIERLVLLSEGDFITEKDLPFYLKNFKKEVLTQDLNSSNILKKLSEIEKEKIISALKLSRFNQTQAAKILGITRRQLSYRIKKYGLEELLNYPNL